MPNASRARPQDAPRTQRAMSNPPVGRGAINNTEPVIYSGLAAGVAMKNITISLDDQTAATVRVEAAKEGKSLSRWIGDLLRLRLAESREYDAAMRAYLARPSFKLQTGTRLPKRDELYDRPRLR